MLWNNRQIYDTWNGRYINKFYEVILNIKMVKTTMH